MTIFDKKYTSTFSVPVALSAPDTVGLLCTGSFALASLILAYEPVLWLFSTWLDRSYQSSGLVYLFAVFGLVLWSLSSALRERSARGARYAVLLLVLSALIRLMSQVLAINMIGGIALALDVFAVLTLLGTSRRSRPLSAFWVSVLFLFTLPVERIAQRILGFPLQEISARGACESLGVIYADLICDGVRLTVAGKDVLVDLPCSGTVGLMLSMAFITGLHAVYRPGFKQAVGWFAVAALLSVAGNTLRINLLAMGLVHHESLYGLDVMAQPVHGLIGYVTIALSLLPVVLFYKPGNRSSRLFHASPDCKTRSIRSYCLSMKVPFLSKKAPFFPKKASVLAGAGFVILSIVIVSLPRHAVDVSHVIEPPALPSNLVNEIARPQPLEPVERAYFEQYGGTAQKAVYGPLALTVVHTTSPLRHLHSPEDCLRGLGYKVEFLGTRFSPVPVSLYRATGKAGDAWHVAVTFLSDRGHITSNIAEAIWLWLQNPKSRWTSVQRITPWLMNDDDRNLYETAVTAALDLTPPTLVASLGSDRKTDQKSN